MSKYIIVALFGKSASGKDTILEEFCRKYPNLNRKISTTTREPRDYEKEGVDYYFTNPTEFAQKIVDGEMLEASCFNDWFYGTEEKTLRHDKINIGVFNPEGVEALIEDARLKVIPICITCPDKIRIIRSLEREGSPDIEEVFRRYKTDNSDFNEIDFEWEEVANDGTKGLDDIVEQVKNIITQKLGGLN